jgi:hypothetical protein
MSPGSTTSTASIPITPPCVICDPPAFAPGRDQRRNSVVISPDFIFSMMSSFISIPAAEDSFASSASFA